MSRNEIIAATMPFTRENRFMSWYYLLSTLVLVVLSYLGTSWIVNPFGRACASVLAGLGTCRLFVIYHDFHHEAILRKSLLAKIIMTGIGLLTLAPSSIWNESHHHHHDHNSKFSRMVIGSFPTITTTTFRNSTPSQRYWYLMLRHPLIIIFAYLPVFLISFCLWPFVENPKKYADCGIAVALHVIIAWLLYISGGWATLFFSLLLPAFILFAVGGYIFYAQHNFSDVVLKDEEDWDYLHAALHSSSYIKMNVVMRWFTANIGYHHIHHVNARIPFYRLPEAMDKLPVLQHPRSTSLHPSEIRRCLRLKLWDPELGKMITLKQYASHT